VSIRRRLRVALALWAAAGAGCGVVGDSERLTDAQAVIADMKIGSSDQPGAGLTIIGAVDHADRRYRAGEPVTLSVEVSKAADVAVLRVMPNGATTLVFPNRSQASPRMSANSPMRIPAPGAPFQIAAPDRPGIVLFEFIAASRGDAWLFSRKPEGSADFAELGTTTRALAKDIALSLRGGRGADTAAVHLTVRVRGD
jgi:hypothetical protein